MKKIILPLILVLALVFSFQLFNINVNEAIAEESNVNLTFKFPYGGHKNESIQIPQGTSLSAAQIPTHESKNLNLGGGYRANCTHKGWIYNGEIITNEQLAAKQFTSDVELTAYYTYDADFLFSVYDGNDPSLHLTNQEMAEYMSHMTLVTKDVTYEGKIYEIEEAPMIVENGVAYYRLMAKFRDIPLTNEQGKLINYTYKMPAYEYKSDAPLTGDLISSNKYGGAFTVCVPFTSDVNIIVSDASSSKPVDFAIDVKYHKYFKRRTDKEPQEVNYTATYRAKADSSVGKVHYLSNLQLNEYNKMTKKNIPTASYNTDNHISMAVTKPNLPISQNTLTYSLNPETANNYVLEQSGNNTYNFRGKKPNKDILTLNLYRKMNFTFKVSTKGAEFTDNTTADKTVEMLHTKAVDQSKIPSVKALDGKNFVGWAKEGDNTLSLIDFTNGEYAKVKEPLTLVPVFEVTNGFVALEPATTKQVSLTFKFPFGGHENESVQIPQGTSLSAAQIPTHESKNLELMSGIRKFCTHQGFIHNGQIITKDELLNKQFTSDAELIAYYTFDFDYKVIVYDGNSKDLRLSAQEMSDYLGTMDYYSKATQYTEKILPIDTDPLIEANGVAMYRFVAKFHNIPAQDSDGNPIKYSERESKVSRDPSSPIKTARYSGSSTEYVTSYTDRIKVKVSDASEQNPVNIGFDINYHKFIKYNHKMDVKEYDYKGSYSTEVRSADLQNKSLSSVVLGKKPNTIRMNRGEDVKIASYSTADHPNDTITKPNLPLGVSTLTYTLDEATAKDYVLEQSGGNTWNFRDKQANMDIPTFNLYRKMNFTFKVSTKGAEFTDNTTADKTVEMLHTKAVDQSKIPSVKALNGKNFVGWAKEGDNTLSLIDFTNGEYAKVKEPLTLVPVFEVDGFATLAPATTPTPEATATPEVTPEATATPEASLEPSVEPSATPEATATPIAPATPMPSVEPSAIPTATLVPAINAPKTGDRENLALLIILMLLSLSTLVVIAKKKNKQ